MSDKVILPRRGETLLPIDDALTCPFCGSQPTIQLWHGGGPRKRIAQCQNEDCDVMPAVSGSTRGRALAKWNRRTDGRGGF